MVRLLRASLLVHAWLRLGGNSIKIPSSRWPFLHLIVFDQSIKPNQRRTDCTLADSATVIGALYTQNGRLPARYSVNTHFPYGRSQIDFALQYPFFSRWGNVPDARVHAHAQASTCACAGKRMRADSVRNGARTPAVAAPEDWYGSGMVRLRRVWQASSCMPVCERLGLRVEGNF